MEQFDIAHATAYYMKAYTKDSTDNVKRKIAKCYGAMGRYRESIAWLNKIMPENVSHSDMRQYYSAYGHLEMADSTIYWAERIVKEYPHDSKIVADLASYFNQTGAPGQAESLAKAYIINDSTNLFVNKQLGYSYYLQDKFKEALTIYLRLKDAGTNTYESNFVIGCCYEELDSLNQAYEHMHNAVKIKDSKDFNSLYQLSMISGKLGLLDEALAYLQEAHDAVMPTPKTMYNVHKNIGAIYYSTEKYKEAGEAFERCLQYIPDDIIACYNAAQMFYAAKDKEKAKPYLKKVIESSKPGLPDTETELIDKAKKQIINW